MPCTAEKGVPAPVITAFTADTSIVSLGQPATLSWNVIGAYRLTLNSQDVTGLSGLAVRPTVGTQYILYAQNSSGSVSSQTLTINVSTQPVTLSITPATATLYAGQAMRFGFALSAPTTRVVWNASAGSIAQDGTFTAPATPGACTVTVISVDDPRQSASAAVTVNPPEVTLTVLPAFATLYPGQTMTLNASIQVTGSADVGIIWSCDGGTLVAKGASAFYAAPLVPGTYTVMATSSADSSVVASATLTVSAVTPSTPYLAAFPANATLKAGQRLFLGADFMVTDPQTGLDWTAALGQVTPDATGASAFYVAPTSPGSTTVTVKGHTHTELSATISLTIEAAGVSPFSLVPSTATLGTGQSMLLEASDAQGNVLTKVTWSIQEQGGGLITAAGQYIAPTKAGIYHVVGSDPADPTHTDTAIITVVAGGSGGDGGGGDPNPTARGVTVSPDRVQVPAGTYQSLSAIVSGLDDQTVTWSVENAPQAAKVDASGIFTANQPGTYRVFATSTADPTLNGSAVIQLVSSVTPIVGAPTGQTRTGYSVTALKDGRILIVGGYDGSGGPLGTGQVYDPASGAFTNVSNAMVGMAYHSAVLLDDGRVLISGGFSAAWDPWLGYQRRRGVIYDPGSNSFQSLPVPATAQPDPAPGQMRSSHVYGTAVKLVNGQVLIVGDSYHEADFNGFELTANHQLRRSDVFDPTTNTFDVSNWRTTDPPEDWWSATPNCFETLPGQTAVALDDGRALITGGRVPPVADLVDPCTGAIKPSYAYSACIKTDARIFAAGAASSTVPMTIPRAEHTMTKLADGRVLIAGGFQSVSFIASPPQRDPVSGLYEPNPHYTATASAEIFDPVAGTFTPTGSMHDARAIHAAILLPTGKVLIVGGMRPIGPLTFSYPTTTELYDPDTGTFEVMEDLGYGLEEPKLALQANGEVFISGTVQGTPLSAGLAGPMVQSVSGSTLPMLGSLLLGQLVAQERSEIHPLQAALQRSVASWLSGGRPSLARLSVPLPSNADLTSGSMPLPIGTNTTPAFLLFKAMRPNVPGGVLQGYSVVLEVVNTDTGTVAYRKLLIGGGGADNPTPMTLSQAQQLGFFQQLRSRSDIVIPNQLRNDVLQSYLEREAGRAAPNLSTTEKQALYEHRKWSAILGWTQTWLPAAPENNANRSFHKIRVDFSGINGLTQDAVLYGLINQGIQLPFDHMSLKFRIKAHYELDRLSYTCENAVSQPLWSVAQLFRNRYYSTWNSDKWVAGPLFRWLFQRDAVGNFTNRNLLEPANDFTMEHGDNEPHKTHFQGDQGDFYHPGYQAFTRSDNLDGSGTDFRESYLIPYLQIARGDYIDPNTTQATATQILADWVRQARIRIYGFMTQARVGLYGPDTFIYLSTSTTRTQDSTVLDCTQLRQLMLFGHCNAYTLGGVTYHELDMTSNPYLSTAQRLGVWGMAEAKWTGLTDTSHTHHIHINWATKQVKFDPTTIIEDRQ